MDISKLRKKAKEQQSVLKQKAGAAGPETAEGPEKEPARRVQEPAIDHPVSEESNRESGTGRREAPAAPPVSPDGAGEKTFVELAREELKDYTQDQKEKELLCFTMEDEEYAIELHLVKEIIRVRDITPVPNTSDFVLGIIVLRGEIIPVINLRKRIGLPFPDFTPNTRFILVSFEGSMTGLVVDNIPSVKRVPVASIQAAELVGAVDIKFVAGISTSKGGFTILLKLEEVLKQSDMLKV